MALLICVVDVEFLFYFLNYSLGIRFLIYFKGWPRFFLSALDVLLERLYNLFKVHLDPIFEIQKYVIDLFSKLIDSIEASFLAFDDFVDILVGRFVQILKGLPLFQKLSDWHFRVAIMAVLSTLLAQKFTIAAVVVDADELKRTAFMVSMGAVDNDLVVYLSLHFLHLFAIQRRSRGTH